MSAGTTGPAGAAGLTGPVDPAGTAALTGPVDPAGPASERRSRLRAAIGWSYLLTAGRVGSSILVTFLLARLLGPTEFGLLAMAMVFITIAQTLIQQGLVSAIVQRDVLTPAHLDAAFGVLLLAGVGLGLLTAAASPLWALLYGAPELTAICLALAPLVLVQALAIVPEALLRRELRFRAVAQRTLLAAVLSGVAGVVLALTGAGVWALVGQQLVNGLVSTVVVWLVCPWRPGRRLRLGAIRELWAFSAHSASAGLGVLLSNRADIIVTGLFFGPVATGIYRLAARLPDMLVDVTVRSLQQVALPSLSRLQREPAALAAQLATLQHLGAVAGLPVLGVLAATAGPLVTLLGPQWAGTETPLRLLCLYGAINVYGVLLGPALQAVGAPGRLALLTWIRAVLGVVVLVALGLLLAGGDDVHQATGVALAGIGLQGTVNTLAIWLTVHRTVGASVLRFLAPTVPAALVALATTLLAPLLAERLGTDALPPLAATGLVGGGATLLTAALLVATDRRLRHLVRKGPFLYRMR